MANQEAQAVNEFARNGFKAFLLWVTPVWILNAYILGVSMGLSKQDSGLALVVSSIPILVVFGCLVPSVLLRRMAEQALRPGDDGTPGARLARILQLPWYSTAWITLGGWTLGGFLYSLILLYYYKLSLFALVPGTLIPLCCSVVLLVPVGLSLEKQVFPLALQEQQVNPGIVATGKGLFWPRHVWFLPFTLVSSIVAGIILAGCVVVTKLLELRETLLQNLKVAGAESTLEALTSSLMTDLGIALVAVCVLVMVLPAITSWMLARKQAQGTTAVRTAIEGLASGKALSPKWVSTDEIGDLAAGLNVALAKLRQLPLTLHSSATRLIAAGNNLSEANAEQQQSLSRQAVALQEAQVTSQEIKQTSLMAAERAETVLRVAKRAEELGQHGEAAIEQSLAGLTSIQEVVTAIQNKLARLEESATQISGITQTVKDLADQSNILALNAAIEAVRSGEHGKGFAVVAKEIRALANQSITATNRIRGILDDISRAIRDAAAMGEKGAQQIATGLNQMKTSGDSLRELSRIAQENSSAVRQIAAAVTQQNAGFTQIFTAISDLSQIMNATLERLEFAQQAAGMLQTISTEVSDVARQFNVN